MLKQALKKVGFGLTILALSLTLFGPIRAANTSSQLESDSSQNIRVLSQFSLVTGELTAVGSSTTTPVNFTLTLDPQHQSRSITVVADDGTIFVRHFFGRSSLSELAVGDHLQIFGRYDEMGVLHALAVKDQSIQLASNLTGNITALDPAAKTFTLSHTNGFSAKWLPLTVRINDNTKIVSTDGKLLSLADLQMQQQVRVSGVLNTQGKFLTASQIKVNYVAPQPLPFSLQGNLIAVRGTGIPTTFTVEVKDVLPPLNDNRRALNDEPINRVTFTVDANTKLTNHAGAVISLADFNVGDSVVVQGSRDNAGNIIATTVRNDSQEVATTTTTAMRIEGSIKSVDANAKTLIVTKADGSTINISVLDKTVLSIPNVNNAAFADLHVGYTVSAEGTLNAQTNVLAAVRITVSNVPEALPFSLKGEILAISGTNLPARLTMRVDDINPPLEMRNRAMMRAEPINEVTVLLTANSKLVSETGALLALDDLEAGDSIVVQGNRNANGEITAAIVHDNDYRDDSVNTSEVSLSGTIRSVDEDNSTVVFVARNGKTYTARVLDSTDVVVSGAADAGLDDLDVGDQVRVSGLLNADANVMQTSKIMVTDHSTDRNGRKQHDRD